MLPGITVEMSMREFTFMVVTGHLTDVDPLLKHIFESEPVNAATNPFS